MVDLYYTDLVVYPLVLDCVLTVYSCTRAGKTVIGYPELSLTRWVVADAIAMKRLKSENVNHFER